MDRRTIGIEKRNRSKNIRRMSKAALSLMCALALLCGMVLESLPLPVAHSMESSLVCGQTEHTHSESCWGIIPYCGQAEHVHSETCFDEQGTTICGNEEHVHGDGCYQRELQCGFAQEHVHTAACYSAPKEAEPEEEIPMGTVQLMAEEAETETVNAISEAETTAEPTAIPTEAPTAVPTAVPTAEPTAIPTEVPTAVPTAVPAAEPTAVPTEAPTEEPSAEPTETPTEAPMTITLDQLTCSTASVKTGESVRWEFHCENADSVSYRIENASDEIVASGELGDVRTIEWSSQIAGEYRLTIVAVQGEEQALLSTSVRVEAEVLCASVSSQQRYAFANRDALVFNTEVTGGSQPQTVEYSVYLNGECVYSQIGYAAQVTYMPVEFGVHTIKMTVTDAAGETAIAEFSVPVAVDERERVSDWEQAFRNIELTGNFAEDIVAVASTQLGYAESERNFIIDEEGKQQGYTRYGDWYGASYSEWCAMFVSFCAHYAQIPTRYLPKEASCAKWKQKLGELYLDNEDSYVPEAGDLIFFHYNRTPDQRTENAEECNVPNHVGIVTGQDDSYIYTIEGNSGKQVRARKYEFNDDAIVGYVSMDQVMALAFPEPDTADEVEMPAEEDRLPFDGASYVEIRGNDVNLRADATIESDRLGQADAGEIFELLSIVENENGDNWYQVILADGNTAFVRSDMAILHETAEEVGDEMTEESDTTAAFERMAYTDELPDGFEVMENGLYRLMIDEESDEFYLLVYGRYGDGEARFYLCDENGVPEGEDMFWAPAAVFAADCLQVEVETDRAEYLNVEGQNTVILTIKIKATNNKALSRGKKLTILFEGGNGMQKLKFKDAVVDGKTVTFSSQETESSIDLTAGDDVNDSLVTLVCEYTIPVDAVTGAVTLNVSASENGKNLSGSNAVTFAYAEASGVRITAVSAPTHEVGNGEVISIPVTVANYDSDDHSLTGFTVTDAQGTVQTIALDDVVVSANSETTVNCSFAAPSSGNGETTCTIAASYTDETGSEQTNVMDFTLKLPVASTVVLADETVLVVYDANDKASFSQIRVKVTDNASSTDGKRNTNNKGRLEIRNGDGTWSTVTEITKQTSISSGSFYFDLNNLSAEQILNNQYRVLITAVNGKDVTTGQPQSSWFRLTDLLPKDGFREWVLEPANGFVDADGNLLIDSAEELAEAYKVYERLGLSASVGAATGDAGGEAAGLTIGVSSDADMISGSIIAIRLSDVTEGLSDVDRILFNDGMEATAQIGTARVENGIILVTLNDAVAAGSIVDVSINVPLSYAAKLGEHDVAAFAQYSQDGAILKQTQHPGQGTITVTAPAGWHLVAADGPDSAVTPGEYVSYTLVARNFEASEVVLTGWSARYNDTDFEIAAVKVGDTVFNKNESGSYADEDGNALTAITVPGASVDADDPSATVAGETIITLRVKAPSEPVSETTVTLGLSDGTKTETMESSIEVIDPAITIKPVVDYDPASDEVTVKLVYTSPSAGMHELAWQSLDSTDAFAEWQQVGVENAALSSTTEHEYILPDMVVDELVDMGENSKDVLFRLNDTIGGATSLSNQVYFENLAELMEAVKVVGELAGHYGYAYADFRELIDNLYYKEVAKDSGVPFSDANSLMLCLSDAYKSGGIGSAAAFWEKYRYDLYDPHEWPTATRKADCGAKNPYPGRETADPVYDFGDYRLGYEKDASKTASNPFHNQPTSKVVEAKGNTEPYFSGLEKRAYAVKNGDENTDRIYTIDLTAKTTNKVMVPAAMVFQIQTSWQMFDLEHANNKNGAVAGYPTSPCRVTSMATLYDIKHGMMDFAEWLRTNSDGSIVFAITDVEHAGSFNAIPYPHFTNDSDTLMKALEGWDIFGNCEHVHYTQTAYDAALAALKVGANFEGWTYNGVSLYDQARKIAIIIGGSTENTNGTNGYGCVIDAGNMDYVYTIRANSGTANPYLSWLDNAGMTALTNEKGKAYKDVDTRQKIFETLKSIVEDYQASEFSRMITDVTISDTITREFSYVAGSAKLVRTWRGETTTTDVSDDEIKFTANEDGTTKVDYAFTAENNVRPGETFHLQFQVIAKEDYIGSNNVYTNTGKASLSYNDTLTGKEESQDFPENPRVNVPIRYNIEDGGQTTIGACAETDVNPIEKVDLWTLGETVVKEMEGAGSSDGINDWATRYAQINGTVTYQWMVQKVDENGNPMFDENGEKILIPYSEPTESVSIEDGKNAVDFKTLSKEFSSPLTGDYYFYLQTTFTPDPKSDEWTEENDGEVAPLVRYGEVIVHVVKVATLSVVKTDENGTPIGGAVFSLYPKADSQTNALEFIKQGEGSYILKESADASLSAETPTTELVCDAYGNLTITGLTRNSYRLEEIKAPDGFTKLEGRMTFDTEETVICDVQCVGNDWQYDADLKTVKVKNKRGIDVPDPGADTNKTSVAIKKAWAGDDMYTSHRSAEVQVELYMDGMKLLDGENEGIITLSESNNWTYNWENLPYADDEGNAHEYSVKELTENPWYTPVASIVGNGDAVAAQTVYQKITRLDDLQSFAEANPNAKYVLYNTNKGRTLSSDKNTNQPNFAETVIGENTYYTSSTIQGIALWSLTGSGTSWALSQGASSITVDDKGNIAFDSNSATAFEVTESSETFTFHAFANKNDRYLKTDKDGAIGKNDGSAKEDCYFVIYAQVTIPEKKETYTATLTNQYVNAPVKMLVTKLWADGSAYAHSDDSVTVKLIQKNREGEIVNQDNQPQITLTANSDPKWQGPFTGLTRYYEVNGAPVEYVYEIEEISANGINLDDYTVTYGDVAWVESTTDESGNIIPGYYTASMTNKPKYSAGHGEPDTSNNKTIDYLGDDGRNPDTKLTGIDKYRLYLDFTGGSEPVDVLFVLDNTSSMETKMDNNSTRAQVLNKIMNGENGQPGIVNQVLAMHPENKVAVIGFGGDYGKYSTYGDVSGTVLLDWTDKSIGYKNFYVEHNGTMFEAGLIRAYELLSNPTVATDGHMKIMLFMSDGEPNAYAEPIMDAAGNVVDYNFYGGKTLADCESHIRREIDRLTAVFPGLNVYTIGVSSDVSPATQTLLTDMTRGSGSFAQADSASAFVEAMQDVINSLIPHGLTITDTLSQYVQLCETQPDIKLTQRDKNGDEVILWQADTLTPNADGSIGTVTKAGGNIVDSVTVSGRTITAKLKDEVYIDASHTYTLSFNVELTEAGWNYERDYPNTGDEGTDYGDNTTSSGKGGFRSNNSASASYTIDGAAKSDAYDHPVVQTAKTAELELNIRKLVDESSKGATEHPRQRFTILLNGAETNPDGWTQTEPYGDIWIDLPANASRQDETVTLQFTQAGTYTFTVKEQPDASAEYWDFDAAEYTVTVTVVLDGKAENTLFVSDVAITAPDGSDNAWRSAHLNPDENSGMTAAIPFRNGYWPPQLPKKTWAEGSAVQAESNVKVGDEITYEIKYFNHNPELTTVTITDELAEYFTFVRADSGGTFDETTCTVTWTKENVPAHTGGSVKLTVKVNDKVVQENGTIIDKVSNTATVQIGNDATQAETTNPVENDVVTLVSLTVTKSDSTDHNLRLSGAKFALYTDEACTKLATAYEDAEMETPITEFTTSGDEGSITIYGLMPGETYYLKELTAPAGYCLIDGALKIHVEQEGTMTEVSQSQRIEDNTADKQPGVIVYDSPLYDIPSTGGQGTRGFYAAGLALMLLAAALMARRRREGRGM